jgi:hypothetical protein
MAGLRGNQASFALAKQTAKGTPNTTYTDRVPFTGGSIAPTRTVDNLSETDANRDQGISYVANVSVEGAPELYVRDANIHHFLEAAFGAIATTGAGPNYTHDVTPANALPYYTLYREIGDTLFEQFNDCMANELTVSADAGAPLTASLSFLGLEAQRLAAQPASITSLTLANQAVYNFSEVAVTLGGGATSLVSSFELTLTNNTSSQQTDDFTLYDVVPGQREVTLGFQTIFETLAEYNEFHYGGPSGTTQSGSLFETDANFTFTKGANNEISFDFPVIAYEEFPVDPDPGGAPIVVDVRARAQRNVGDIASAQVKNQAAT